MQILAAAQTEFAASGYRGARIERIATLAGCNRALVYHYFRTKAVLFRATLDHAAQYRAAQMAGQPQTLADGLIYWFHQNLSEPQLTRLIMQEALAEDAALPAAAERPQYLAAQLEMVRTFQRSGRLRVDLDPRHLLTAFLALTSFPACFPQIAAPILGGDAEAARESWEAWLRDLAALLQPA